MKYSKLFLSALLPMALLSGCSATEEAVDDVEDKVEDVVDDVEDKKEDERELAFTIGTANDMTKEFRIDNELGATIKNLYLSETGTSSDVNVLPSDWENGKVVAWNLDVAEGTTYTMIVETEDTAYSFDDLDLSNVDVKDDMEIAVEATSVQLEYTALDGKEVSVVALSTALTDLDALNEQEASQSYEQEGDYSAQQGVYEDSGDVYDYDSSYSGDSYYDNSYDYSYDYETPSYDTGYDSSYDTALPGQNQDACLGEDALIQY